MSSEYILTLEAIDRRLYSKDGSRSLMRFSASDIVMPENCHTPQGLSEECLNYMTEILTKHGRPNLRMDHFLFLHFGGWEKLMDYTRTDEKRRGFLLRCEEKGYSVAEERAAFDRMLIDGPADFSDRNTGKKPPEASGKKASDQAGKNLPKRSGKKAGGKISSLPFSGSDSADAGKPLPSLHMRCIVEANIFIVKKYCGLYSGKGTDMLRGEIGSFLQNSPDEERHLSPQIDPADRYAVFRHIRGLLEEYDNARTDEAKWRALGTALAWLLLAALLRDRCRCLCLLLPQEVQILHIEEREALRGDLPAIAPVSMPPRTGRIFRGREKELAWISEEFRNKRSPVWITGDGGCGKTSLALRYAASISDAYCIYAVFHDNLQSTIADIRFRDRLTYSEIPEEELYSFHLSRIAQYGSRLLLIIDNFDAPGYDMTFPEMLDAPCGECGEYAEEDCRGSAVTNFSILNSLCRTGTRILLTTRLHVPPQYASVCLSDEEHLLSRDELASLAKEIYDDHEWTESEEVMMEEIVLAVGKHVMAVELIAAALKYNAGFSTIAEVLEKVRAGHYSQISGDARSGRGETGSRRFKGSSSLYEQMAQLFSFSVFSKEQKALLRILSLLPQTGLDRPLFTKLCEGIFAQENLRRMLLRFRDLHLITLRPVVSMHSVTADLAADALRPDAENCGALLRNALAFCAQYEPPSPYTPARAETGASALYGPPSPYTSSCTETGASAPYGPPSPYTSACAETGASAPYKPPSPRTSARAETGTSAQTDSGSVFQPQNYTDAGTNPGAVGRYSPEVPDYRLLAQVSRLLMRCHDRIEEQSFSRKENSLSPAFIALKISLAEYRLGHHLTALRWAESALRGTELYGIKEEENNTRLRDYADICSALAQAEAASGFYENAVSHYLDAIRVRRQLPGGGIPEIAIVYNDLSVVYCEIGEYESADDCLQKALQIQTDVYGPDHMEISTTYNNIGLLRSGQGDHEKAIEYYEKSLRLHLSCHGELHPDTAVIFCNLGQEYSDLGDLERAADYLGRALRINTELFGEDYSGNAGICNNIGILYDDLSRAAADEDRSGDADQYYSEAFHWYWKSLSILEKNYGKEHPRTADLYLNMAFACLEHGEVVNGFRCYESAIAILEKTFGAEHPKTLAAKEEFAAAKDALGT